MENFKETDSSSTLTVEGKKQGGAGTKVTTSQSQSVTPNLKSSSQENIKQGNPASKRILSDKELIGTRFGKLVLIKRQGYDKRRCRVFLCKCDCGNELVTSIGILNRKKEPKRMCPDCSYKTRLKHGLAIGDHTKHHPVYKKWRRMIQRTQAKDGRNYEMYSARGITVCERWKDAKNFVEDMSPSWKEGHSLERIDNDKGYYPENCKWIPMAKQARNTRRNKVYKGKSMAEWAEITGIKYSTLRSRLNIYGWSWEKALANYDDCRNRKTSIGANDVSSGRGQSVPPQISRPS